MAKAVGPLTQRGRQIGRLLRDRRLLRFVRYPFVMHLFCIQVALGIVNMVMQGSSDVEKFLLLVTDCLCLAGLAWLYKTSQNIIHKFPQFLHSALPTLEEVESRVVSPGHVAVQHRQIASGRRLLSVTTPGLMAGVAALIFMPLFSGLLFFEFWMTADFSMWFFISKYALQNYCVVPTTLACCVLQSCHIAAITALSTTFDLLSKYLKDVREGGTTRRGPPFYNTRLEDITRLHSKVTLLSAETNRLFGGCMTVFFWSGGAVSMVCLLRILVCGVDERSIYILFICPITNFWCCLLGERLGRASLGLSEAAYSCDWLALSPDSRRLLLLVITRSNHPQTVTVPLIGPMTYCFYTSTLSFWYNNVTMMRNVVQKSR